jgi:plastocyanin
VQTFGPSNACIPVNWSTDEGALSSTSSITDANGYAETHWTLGTAAKDSVAVVASISGAEGSPLWFTARAVAGPAVSMATNSSTTWTWYTAPAYAGPGDGAWVHVQDAYGNGVANQPIEWTVVEGPVHLDHADTGTSEGDPDDPYSPAGFAGAFIAPDGAAGTGVVEARLSGTQLLVQFTINIEAANFTAWSLGGASFISGANGSSPAVDTIPVGTTMQWFLADFDYDSHTLVSVGNPSFPDLPVGYSDRFVSMTFTEPGTYHYQDATYPSATGTLVVQ